MIRWSLLVRGVLPCLLVLCGCDRSNPSGPASLTAPRGFAYRVPRAAYAVGLWISPNVPTVKGPVDTFTVDPPLPAGLRLDPRTGILTGVPERILPETVFRVTAANVVGEASTELRLEVRLPRARRVWLPAADGRSLSWAWVEPDSGEVHPAGTVSVAGRLVSVAPHPRLAVLYGLVQAGRRTRISTWLLDPDTGRPEPAGDLGLDVVEARGLVAHPRGGELYVFGPGDPGALRVSLDAGTGLPRRASRTGGTLPLEDLAFTSDGRLAIGRTVLRTVLGFRYEAGDGGLTPRGAALDAGGRPREITMHPTRPLAWVCDWSLGDLRTFALAPEGLSQVARLPVGSRPSRLAVGPLGRLGLVISAGTLELRTFALDERGRATLRASERIGRLPNWIEMAPTAAHAWVASTREGQVVRYAVDRRTGALGDPLPVRSWGPLGRPVVDRGVTARTPVARRAYVVARRANRLFVHDVSPDTGAFGVPEALDTGLGPQAVAVHAGGRAVYVANASGSLTVYRVARSGRHDPMPLARRVDGWPPVVGADPVDLAPSPDGRRLYVAYRGSHRIGIFETSDAGSAVALRGLAPTGTSPVALALHPDGRHLFAVAERVNELWLHRLDAEGFVEGRERYAVGSRPSDVVLDASGRLVYVTCRGSGTLVRARLDAGTRRLEDLDTIRVGGAPSAIVADPTGPFLFVHMARSGSGPDAAGAELAAYEIVTPQGHLIERSRLEIPEGGDATRLAVDPAGGFVVLADPAFQGHLLVARFDRSLERLGRLARIPTGAGAVDLAFGAGWGAPR